MLGGIWGQEKKGTTEDEMAEWHHWLNGHEFGWTPGVGDGQGGLVCCNSWDRKELDTTERLNWTELNWILQGSTFFTVQLSQPYVTPGKTIALNICTFVDRVMSLLFNTLSRLVIAPVPKSSSLLISWLQSPSAVILEPKNRKSVATSTISPSICHELMGPDAMILDFLIFSLQPALWLSSFTFIKKLFSSFTFSH